MSHKDRLLRFGHELVFQLCQWSGANIVIHKEEDVVSFEQELCKDVMNKRDSHDKNNPSTERII